GVGQRERNTCTTDTERVRHHYDVPGVAMTPHQRWRSRRAAGLELADLVAARLDEPSSVLVLGLPRGGVAVAAPLAATLGAELDVLVVRKAGVPWRPELAMGAVTADDVRVRNDDVLERVDVAEREIDRAFDAA